jgi:hypothetical protein
VCVAGSIGVPIARDPVTLVNSCSCVRVVNSRFDNKRVFAFTPVSMSNCASFVADPALCVFGVL